MKVTLEFAIDVPSLGQKIKQKRQQDLRSLEQLCQLADINPVTWNRIEREKFSLSRETLRKIEQVFGVDFGVDFKPLLITDSCPWTIDQQQNFLRAMTALAEIGATDAIASLVNIVPPLINEQIQEQINELKSGLPEWAAIAQNFIAKRQPFLLTYHDHEYHCRYGEIITRDRRSYLQAWCEETAENEIEDLAHNRTFRIDREAAIEPSDGYWRFQGLDFIAVKLQLMGNLAKGYTVKAEDESVGSEDGNLIVVKRVTSLFWLFQEIQKYGRNCKIVAPMTVKDKFVEELRAAISLYI
jgi:transcriptional regulator with XRE-family HTH domain